MVYKFKVLLFQLLRGISEKLLGFFLPYSVDSYLTMYQSWCVELYTVTATLVGKTLK